MKRAQWKRKSRKVISNKSPPTPLKRGELRKRFQNLWS